MEWILFTIGLLVGSILGMIIVGIVSSGKMSDLDSEIISLRIQRNLLKDELLKQKPKRRYKKKPFKRNIKNKMDYVGFIGLVLYCILVYIIVDRL